MKNLVLIITIVISSLLSINNLTAIPPSAAILKEATPYLIKENSVKNTLDEIFYAYPPFSSVEDLQEAGFNIIKYENLVHVCVLTHPKLPDYFIKLYLVNEIGKLTGNEWLINRCKGADNVRELIKKKKLKHFTVPNKALYLSPHGNLVLIAQDMQLVSGHESERAWKKVPNKEILRELYLILSHGYASTWVPYNIPYTKNGTFTCIDTEYVKRNLKLHYVTPFLSPAMAKTWKKMIAR